MGIFDLFNFKQKLAAIATKENFDLIHDTIKAEIIKQVKEKSKNGAEKMNTVLEKTLNIITLHIHSDNKIVQWIIDNVLIKGIRILAQSIYEDLKEVIKNL